MDPSFGGSNQLSYPEQSSNQLPRQLSPIEHLQLRKARTEAELADINAALSALEANPELMNVLHLVGKALGR